MSHVAPRLTPLGKTAAGTFSPNISPLAPEGHQKPIVKLTRFGHPLFESEMSTVLP